MNLNIGDLSFFMGVIALALGILQIGPGWVGPVIALAGIGVGMIAKFSGKRRNGGAAGIMMCVVGILICFFSRFFTLG